MSHLHHESSRSISPIQAMRLRRHHLVYGLLISSLLLIGSASLVKLSPYHSDQTSQYYRGAVISAQAGQSPSMGDVLNMQVKLLDGPGRGNLVAVQANQNIGDKAAKRIPIGSQILLYKDRATGNQYNFVARWYMPGIATLFIILLILVMVIGGWRGITSVFGLAISIAILATFVVPKILTGHNAFIICIIGAVLITIVSVYVAHGLSKRTTVALFGSLITLALIVGLTALASYVTGTSEIITEENIGVLYTKQPIDIAGLLTGGVVIASLGALFDITTGQAATVDEIHKADHAQSLEQLFWKGMSVGREHIAALINTLALVYVGVALPTIITTIVFSSQANYHAPLIVSLNTETVAEEVMRTCVASIGMLLALPVTTWLAAYMLPRWSTTVDGNIKRWLKEL